MKHKRKLTTKEIYDIVPNNAKSIMCVLRYGDDVKKFKETVVREVRNKACQLERVILVFHKDIPNEYCKQIMKDMIESLDGEEIDADAPQNIHLMGRGGFSNGDIKKLLRKAKMTKPRYGTGMSKNGNTYFYT